MQPLKGKSFSENSRIGIKTTSVKIERFFGIQNLVKCLESFAIANNNLNNFSKIDLKFQTLEMLAQQRIILNLYSTSSTSASSRSKRILYLCYNTCYNWIKLMKSSVKYLKWSRQIVELWSLGTFNLYDWYFQLTWKIRFRSIVYFKTIDGWSFR